MLFLCILEITWEGKVGRLKEKEVLRKMFKVKEPVGNKDKIRPRKRRGWLILACSLLSVLCTKC